MRASSYCDGVADNPIKDPLIEGEPSDPAGRGWDPEFRWVEPSILLVTRVPLSSSSLSPGHNIHNAGDWLSVDTCDHHFHSNGVKTYVNLSCFSSMIISSSG